MAGGQVLINTNVALTGIRDVAWRVCEWAASTDSSSLDALEQYSTAVRAGVLVACTSVRPRMVLWHFTPKQVHDSVFKPPMWREIDKGMQPVSRLPFAAARLLETAVANAIEARLLTQRSYVLVPPNALATSSSLPLSRAGPLGAGSGLQGTLGVEVAAFVQGDQLGIVAQVKRFPYIAIRPSQLKKVPDRHHYVTLVLFSLCL